MKTTFLSFAVALATSVAFAQQPVVITEDGDAIVGSCTQDPDQSHLQTCYVCLGPDYTWCENQTCTKDNPPACGPSVRPAGDVYADIHAALSGLEFFTQVLNDARRAGRADLEAYALGNIGVAYSSLGDPRRAISMYDLALLLHRESGDRRGESGALGNLGLAHMDLGDARTAFSLHERTLAIAGEIGDRRGVAYTLYNMSLALDRLDRRLEAIAHAETALEMLEKSGDPAAILVTRQLERMRE